MSTIDKEMGNESNLNVNGSGTNAGANQPGALPAGTSSTARASPLVQEFFKLGILLIIVFIIRSSIFGLYVIPTGSMLPTIKIDDRVIANKLAYGLILPFGERQIISWDKPKRGDIVLFQSPAEEHTFVKRVAGIEGDRITFRNGVLHVNGTPVQETEVKDRSILDDMGDSPDGKTLYLESGLGDAPHYVMRATSGAQTLFETREFIVPPGRVFCLGDNRDGSNDSRGWGPVEVDKIYGKATHVFYSTIRTDGWIPKFRTDRFFKPLQ